MEDDDIARLDGETDDLPPVPVGLDVRQDRQAAPTDTASKT